MQKKKTLILFGLLLVQSIWASHTENPIDYVRPQIDEFGGWKKINSKKTLVKSRHIEGEEGGEYVVFNKLKNNQVMIYKINWTYLHSFLLNMIILKIRKIPKKKTIVELGLMIQ